ncbi:MAG: LuxR C-terminal-related transcriptional regulator [Nitrospirota bacterium]
MNRYSDLQMDTYDDRRNPRSTGRPVIIKYSPLPPHVPIFVSDNISDHLGYEPGDVIGNPSFLIDMVHPDDFDQFISSLFHLFIRGSHLYDYRLLRKDRSISRMIVELQLHRDDTGAPVSINGIYADPSMLAGTSPSAYLLSASSVDEMAVIELVIDGSGRIRDVNRSVTDVLGYKPRDLIGVSILKIIPSDYHVLLRQALTRMLDNEMDMLFFWIAARHHDGTVRFLANECKGFNDTRGERNFKARCHDITERMTAAQASFSAFRNAAANAPGASSDPYQFLTRREREILSHVVQGQSSTTIAARLSISPRTVEAHRANLMRKLRVTSITQLIRYACCCTALPPAK